MHNTEEKIIHAAMDVFVTKGRDGAKMQEIADKAGINKALLHYYFRTKEKLYEKIFEKVFLRFFTQLENVHQENVPFKEQLAIFINTYVDVLNQNRQVPLFIARELSKGGGVIRHVVSSYVKSQKINVPGLFLTTIEKAQKNGEIVDTDPRHFIMTLIGASIFYFVAEPIVSSILLDEKDFDRAAFIESRKQAIFDLLYYGLKPRGDAK